MDAIISVKNKAIVEIANNLQIPLYFNNSPTLVPGLHNLIRWGSTKFSNSGAEVIWNPGHAIARSSNKRLCREILWNNQIPVPTSGESTFPCIGRPDRHTRGRKFTVCRSSQDVARAKRLGCTYFSVFYPKTREYRVHVGSGRVLYISEKVGGNHPFVWNHAKGYVFEVLRRGDWREDVYIPAIRALEVLKLDFGAVDVMADAIAPWPSSVISEVNTAPSLSPYGIEKYTEYFRNCLLQY